MRPMYFVFLALVGCVGAAEIPEDSGDIDTEDTADDDTGEVGDPDVDNDHDGFSENQGDCNDGQPAINPSATDLVGDSIDQNCDGIDGFDGDGDGFASLISGGTDCDDTDSAIFPGAVTEASSDECMKDTDADGYGDMNATDPFDPGTDCDDADFYTFPGAVELWYDGVRQDCDDWGDPLWSDGDQDGDGHDADFVGGDDCVDTDASISPSTLEVNGDNIDQNCNGLVDGLRATITWDPTATGSEIAFSFVMYDDPLAFSLYLLRLNTSGEVYFFHDLDPDVGVNEPAMSWLELPASDTELADEFTTLTYMYESDSLGCITWGPIAATVAAAWECVESTDPTTW